MGVIGFWATMAGTLRDVLLYKFTPIFRKDLVDAHALHHPFEIKKSDEPANFRLMSEACCRACAAGWNAKPTFDAAAVSALPTSPPHGDHGASIESLAGGRVFAGCVAPFPHPRQGEPGS